VTPILQHQFNWDNLSVAAGITLWQFYFRVYDGTMGKEEVLDFVRHLNKQIQQRILRVVAASPGMPVSVLAEQLGVSTQLALYHLRKLSQAQRLELGRSGFRLRAYPGEGEERA